jgi:proteasome alpha subunit
MCLSVFAVPGAYDRAITVFSPDGRLFQVEYALAAVDRGPTIIGVSCPEGVVIGAEEKVESKLQDPNFSQKIFAVDEHLGAAVVGISSDARILIDESRVYSQSNRLMYDEPIDVEIVTKRIGDVMQIYTQHAGVRPFGVSLIFGGVDKTGAKLYATDPIGSYRSYKALAIGIGRETAENIMREEYRDDLKLEQAVSLAVKCLVKSLQARDEQSRIRLAVVPTSTKTFAVLPNDEVEKRQADVLGSGK